MINRALIEQLDALELQVKTIRTLLATAGDELLTLHQIKSEFDIGRAAISAAVAAGKLKAQQSSRRRIVVRRSELETWLASRAYLPNTKRDKALSIDPYAADLAELERVKSRRS